jgi:Na+/melibiose symporter-like transporter
VLVLPCIGVLHFYFIFVYFFLRPRVSPRAFVCVCILYVCDWCAVQLIQNNLLLYVTYVLKRPEKFTEVVIIVQVSTILFIPVWTKVARKWGKRAAYYAGGWGLLSCFFKTKKITGPR